MLKLVSEKGRWATHGNTMIFSNVVYLCSLEDMNLYHLIDENGNDMHVKQADYLVQE